MIFRTISGGKLLSQIAATPSWRTASSLAGSCSVVTMMIGIAGRGRVLLQVADQAAAVHVGHVVVRDDQVKRLPGHRRHGLGPVGRLHELRETQSLRTARDRACVPPRCRPRSTRACAPRSAWARSESTWAWPTTAFSASTNCSGVNGFCKRTAWPHLLSDPASELLGLAGNQHETRRGRLASPRTCCASCTPVMSEGAWALTIASGRVAANRG